MWWREIEDEYLVTCKAKHRPRPHVGSVLHISCRRNSLALRTSPSASSCMSADNSVLMFVARKTEEVIDLGPHSAADYSDQDVGAEATRRAQRKAAGGRLAGRRRSNQTDQAVASGDRSCFSAPPGCPGGASSGETEMPASGALESSTGVTENQLPGGAVPAAGERSVQRRGRCFTASGELKNHTRGS